MKLDLDRLKTEILEYLGARNFVVFHGESRLRDSLPVVRWNSEHYPDYRKFVEVAKQAEVNLIVFHDRPLTADAVEEALARLEDCDLPPEEQRSLDRRLRDLNDCAGFTCVIELSFDYQGRLYLYDLRTDWFEDFLDCTDEIEAALEQEDEEEGGSMKPYFSRN